MDILKKAQNTDPLKYVPETYYEDFKKVLNITCKGKEDSSSYIINPEDIKDENILKILDEFKSIGRKEAGMPNDGTYKLRIGVYMRKAKMEIPECDNKAVYRVIFNLGYSEVYNFCKADEKKPILFEKNSYMIMPLLDYKIITSSKTMNQVETNSIHAAGFSNKPRIIIRPIMYQRITIVIDYYAPENITEGINKTIHNITNKINEANELTKTSSKRKKNKALYSALNCKKSEGKFLENKPKDDKLKASKSTDTPSDSDNEYEDQ